MIFGWVDLGKSRVICFKGIRRGERLLKGEKLGRKEKRRERVDWEASKRKDSEEELSIIVFTLLLS